MSNARKAATPELQVETDRVRVVKWSFAPGAATGFHVHEHDYVVAPVTGSNVLIVDAEGRETRVRMVAGQSYARPKGVAHDVINEGPGPLVFVEVELK